MPSPRFTAALVGSLDDYMKEEIGRVQRGVLVAVGGEATDLKNGLRNAVDAAFAGSRVVKGGRRRVSNAIRSQLYPNDAEGIGARAIVFSKFGRGRPSAPDFVDYLLPQIEGATIRPKRAKRLMVPIDPSLRGVRGPARRQQLQSDPSVEPVPLPDGRVMLVRRTRTRTRLLAVLTREVHIRRKLDVDRLIRQSEERLPARIAAEIDNA